MPWNKGIESRFRFSEKDVVDLVFMIKTLLADSFHRRELKNLPTCLVNFALVPGFAPEMINSGVFRALVNLASQKMTQKMSVTCFLCFTNAYRAYQREGVKNTAYILDKTGLLTQVLRGLTLPALLPELENIAGGKGLDWFVDSVLLDMYLIRKRMKSGMPTRKILDGILDGSIGFKPERSDTAGIINAVKVRKKLKLIQKKCELVERVWFDGVCQNCHKNEAPYLCHGCECVNYCSRQCQKND